MEHWGVLVITPHKRLTLGPTQALRCFLDHHVAQVNVETLGQSQQSNPLANLLIPPVLPEPQITACRQAILDQRPQLLEWIVTTLMERFATLSVNGTRDGKPQDGTSYDATGWRTAAEALLKAIRQRWSIENS